MRNIDDCRPYLEHIRLEHRHVHESLHQTRQLLSDVCRRCQERDELQKQFVDRLIALKEELVRHFAEEEAGGCLEEAASRSPSVAEDVKRVEGEHPALRATIDRLVEQATHLPQGAAELEKLQAEFESFARQLKEHEASENRILLYGFGAEVMDEIMEDVNFAE